MCSQFSNKLMIFSWFSFHIFSSPSSMQFPVILRQLRQFKGIPILQIKSKSIYLSILQFLHIFRSISHCLPPRFAYVKPWLGNGVWCMFRLLFLDESCRQNIKSCFPVLFISLTPPSSPSTRRSIGFGFNPPTPGLSRIQLLVHSWKLLINGT